MIDLTAPTAADQMFVVITSEEPSPARSRLIREFCKTFWSQLSREHRDVFRRCYVNPVRFAPAMSEAGRLAGEAAYDWGMARQDREMMSY